jgi:hypothetical protein
MPLKNIGLLEASNKILAILCFVFIYGCNKNVAELISTPSASIDFPETVKNVTIFTAGDLPGFGPCEPSISISPVDPNLVVAGSIMDYFHISKDGGKTWKNSKLKSSYGVFGDPVTMIDGKGKIYYAHLSDPKNRPYSSPEFLDRIVVQTSADGTSFTDGTFPPGDRLKDQDKHWLAYDPKSNDILMTWTEFDEYGSKAHTCKSRILFSVSRDQGASWSTALPISEIEGDCVDDDETTEGAVPAVGIDGTYYVVWSYNDKIYMDISKDHGLTWLKKDIIIGDQPGGWVFDIPGISRCNGMPVIKIDHSNTSTRGNMYVSWADQRNGSNDTDIWCMSSTDQGKTWSTPKRINDDNPGHHQFLSWMDIDESTGFLYFVFYDRRNYTDNQTDVYLAYSSDGLSTVVNKKISESPFLPNSITFFGDYNDISASQGTVRPIWTRLHKDVLSVHTAIINIK